MEDLGLDPLTWEHDLPSMANVQTRVEYGMAEAVYAIRMINQNTAGAVVAIHSVLAEARETPSVFVGPHASAHNRDHVGFAVRAAVSDLAVQMSLSEDTVLNYDRQATVMMFRTPKTWAVFRVGEVTPQNAKVVTELAGSLPDDDPELWARFDDAVAELAVRLSPARFRPRARVIREKLLGATLEERVAAERAFRKVIFEPAPDGMAWLSYYGPADDATLMIARVEERARELMREPGETRTMDQLRADVFAEIMLTAGGEGGGSAVGVKVGLLVPVKARLRESD